LSFASSRFPQRDLFLSILYIDKTQKEKKIETPQKKRKITRKKNSQNIAKIRLHFCNNF